ncbi:hypothetical protein ACFW4O_34855, partial [Streptomyces mutabilis]
MLEPTEPTGSATTSTDTESNTPSDTLPPRRRRRAASRPAGPPSGASEASAESVAPADVTPVTDEAEETEAAGTTAPEPAPAGRPRRRA